jgi:hypothetical protein
VGKFLRERRSKVIRLSEAVGRVHFQNYETVEFVGRVRVESQSYVGVNRKNTLGESIFKVRVRSGRTVEIRWASRFSKLGLGREEQLTDHIASAI